MKEKVEWKLRKIADIWNNYILDYKFCNSQIKFTEDVKLNYFGDILKYFLDTFEVIFQQNETETFTEAFGQTISFLQAIYIQQDFIEELLFIFKCKIEKGDLKKDANYSLNRNIRNELVGHPIRKHEVIKNKQENKTCLSCGSQLKKSKKDLVLLSSTLFSDSTSNKIAYFRYHMDNNYKFEKVTHDKNEIIERHMMFLDFYFDIILERLKLVLKKFYTKIEEIEKVLKTAPFNNIIKVTSDSFEYILTTDSLYKPEILIEIEKRKKEHKRYANGVDIFLRDLNSSLASEKESIEGQLASMYQKKEDNSEERTKIIHIVRNIVKPKINKKISYQYELSKLVSNKDQREFDFSSSALLHKCQNKKNVRLEIEHMAKNFHNNLEYYSAYHLIVKILKVD